MKKLLFALMKYYSKGNVSSFTVYLEAIIVLLIPVVLVLLALFFYISEVYQFDVWLLNSDTDKISGRFKSLIALIILLVPTAFFLYRLRASILRALDDYMQISEKTLSRLRFIHYTFCAFAFACLIVTIVSIY